jgi:hypothetical protein
MKKSVVIFVLALLVLLSTALWFMNTKLSGNIPEILMIAGVLILVGFAVYIGVIRFRSALRKEPAEDEFSRRVMTKASSLSFYISIYWWLFLMYMSDKTSLAIDTLIGAGIMGMALIFLFSWIGVKFIGPGNA